MIAGASAARTRSRPRRAPEPRVLSAVTVRVAEPPHLCRVQAAARELCRSIGLDESDVFEAVIEVSELAHRLFIERGLSGDVALSVVRAKGTLAVEVRAGTARLAYPRVRNPLFS